MTTVKKGQTVTKKNLFASAGKKTSAPKSASTDRPEASVKDKELFKSVKALSEVRANIKADKAEESILTDEVREASKELFIKQYQKDGRFTGSMDIKVTDGKETASLMFIPQDKYKKVDDERAEELISQFGEDTVTESTNYGFNAKMVEKYAEVLSDLIMNSKDISEDDKGSIIEATTSYTVKKGMIKELGKMNQKKMGEVLENIQPTYLIKDPKVEA